MKTHDQYGFLLRCKGCGSWWFRCPCAKFDPEDGDATPQQAHVNCPKHGRQPALNVPGLTSEPTCVECI